MQPLLFSLRAGSCVMTFILQATAAKALKNNNDMSAAMDSLSQETFFSSYSKELSKWNGGFKLWINGNSYLVINPHTFGIEVT